MNPEEKAKEILENAETCFRIIDCPEKAVRHFAMQAARNDIAELQIRRQEIFPPEAPEWQEQFWEEVKTELEKI